MSGWRQFAQTLKERTTPCANSVDSANSLQTDAIGTNGTNGTGWVAVVIAPCATDDPVAWALALTQTDPSRPMAGYDPARWRCLIDDARWLCRCHGDAAHGLGWVASDLFGLGAAPGWGGLADYLAGSRNLVLTDRIAHWRGDELEGWLWRQTMRPMPLIWEVVA